MSVLAKRGTKAQVDAAAGSAGLLTGELIHITDEGRLAIATGTGAYASLAKQSETTGKPTSATVSNIVTLTQTAYDGLTPDANTLYFITE